jgi:hypothetical protein
MTRGMAREADSSVALSAAPDCLVDRVVIISPSALHPRAVKVARHRPVYWLAGLSVPSAFPERKPPVASKKGSSPLTVAGAATAIKLALFTAFPSCVPRIVAGTDDDRNYRLDFHRRKQDRLEFQLR